LFSVSRKGLRKAGPFLVFGGFPVSWSLRKVRELKARLASKMSAAWDFRGKSLPESLPESEFIIETIGDVSKGILQSRRVVAVGCLM
jgi:hypothetical protein